jgi:hypothetical protein
MEIQAVSVFAVNFLVFARPIWRSENSDENRSQPVKEKVLKSVYFVMADYLLAPI